MYPRARVCRERRAKRRKEDKRAARGGRKPLKFVGNIFRGDRTCAFEFIISRVHRASYAECDFHCSFFKFPEPEEQEGRKNAQGDAFRDRKAPNTETLAKEVKGIKRMRIFTEKHGSDMFHISAASLSLFSPRARPFFFASR